MTNTAWPRIVGVLHLPPLPGAAKGGAASSMRGLIDAMLRDAQLYADAGIDTVIVENYGDLPFVRDRVDAAVTAGCRVGIEVLRHGREAIAETGRRPLRQHPPSFT